MVASGARRSAAMMIGKDFIYFNCYLLIIILIFFCITMFSVSNLGERFVLRRWLMCEIGFMIGCKMNG